MKMFIAAFIVMIIGAFMFVPASTVGASAALDKICADNPDSGAVCSNKEKSSDTLVKSIVNTLLFVVGAVSVIMIIIGGIRYVVASGNAASVTGAKNTVLYAIVGLIAAFLAYALVNWVLQLF